MDKVNSHWDKRCYNYYYEKLTPKAKKKLRYMWNKFTRSTSTASKDDVRKSEENRRTEIIKEITKLKEKLKIYEELENHFQTTLKDFY